MPASTIERDGQMHDFWCLQIGDFGQA
jgi:hypothetical protein